MIPHAILARSTRARAVAPFSTPARVWSAKTIESLLKKVIHLSLFLVESIRHQLLLSLSRVLGRILRDKMENEAGHECSLDP